jgi:hypothetical protein
MQNRRSVAAESGGVLFNKLWHLRSKSLIRGSLVVILSLVVATLLSHAPRLKPNAMLVLPLLTSIAGTADTIRCMQKTWTWYHGGVVLCIYMDLMVMTLIAFFLLYPYFA